MEGPENVGYIIIQDYYNTVILDKLIMCDVNFQFGGK